MRRILIADDEKRVREGIKFLLKENGFQGELIEAAHGRAALEYLQFNKADILLTDVMMPYINGLELMKEANILYPEMKCIVISGFRDFEYVRRAMELGADNYIVKPVDPEEFRKAMDSVWVELKEREKGEKIRQKENRCLREHILFLLVNGIPLEILRKQYRAFVNMEFDKYDRMILIEANGNFFVGINDIFQDELKKHFFLSCDYLNLNMHQSILLFKGKDSTDYTLLGKQIYDFILKSFKEPCYLAVSRPLKDIRELPEVFKHLEKLMENKFYETETCVFEETIEKKTLHRMVSQDECMENIIYCISNGNIEGLKKEFETLCGKYKGQGDFSQIYVKFLFSNIMKEISKELKSPDSSRLETDIEKLYKSSKIQEVIDLAEDYIKSFERNLTENNTRGDIQAIKKFIFENYKKDISVELLAEKVCLSPSYVSYIFKKETGCNLTKFIKNYRMEKAKELLKNTQMKVVDICQESGYTNTSYFCQNFKYTFGVSPEKFRQTGERNTKKADGEAAAGL